MEEGPYRLQLTDTTFGGTAVPGLIERRECHGVQQRHRWREGNGEKLPRAEPEGVAGHLCGETPSRGVVAHSDDAAAEVSSFAETVDPGHRVSVTDIGLGHAGH